MCWCCCPKRRQKYESEQALLGEDENYQSGKQLKTGGREPKTPKINPRDSEDPEQTDSYDAPTDNEDDHEINASVQRFLRNHESNETLSSEYYEQFMKLLKRRRFRRTIVYLGKRKDLSHYEETIKERISPMVKNLEPVPEKEKVELVLDAMVQLILDAEIRAQIVESINGFMSAE